MGTGVRWISYSVTKVNVILIKMCIMLELRCSSVMTTVMTLFTSETTVKSGNEWNKNSFYVYIASLQLSGLATTADADDE